MRKLINNQLRRPVRIALLDERPLPTKRWERVSGGHQDVLGSIVALAVDAAPVSPVERARYDIPARMAAALRVAADVIERELPRAA